MDITYDIILNTLKPNINIYNIFKNIFDNSYLIYKDLDKNDNVTFFDIILYCLDSYDNDNTLLFSNFIDSISRYYHKLNLDFKKKYSLNKVVELIKTNDIIILDFICQYLKINIFIFDIQSKNIYVSYYKTFLNGLRETILLSYDKNKLYPIINPQQKSFTYNNSDVISKILKNHVEYFNTIYFNKKLKIKSSDEIYSDVSNNVTKENKTVDDNSSDEVNKVVKINQTLIESEKNNIFIKKYSIDELKVKKKIELKNILEKEYNIIIKNLLNTRKDKLIKLILEFK